MVAYAAGLGHGWVQAVAPSPPQHESPSERTQIAPGWPIRAQSASVAQVAQMPPPPQKLAPEVVTKHAQPAGPLQVDAG